MGRSPSWAAAPTTRPTTAWSSPGPSTGWPSARPSPGPVAVYTDSTYVIQGIRQWIWGWRSRGWRTATGTEVLNRDLWERLSTLVDARGKGGIAWHYVRGHIGTPGNERVDEIADGFAQRRDIQLYRGPLSGYPLPILELPEDTDVPPRRAGSSVERQRQDRRTPTSASSTARRCGTRRGPSASGA